MPYSQHTHTRLFSPGIGELLLCICCTGNICPQQKQANHLLLETTVGRCTSSHLINLPLSTLAMTTYRTQCRDSPCHSYGTLCVLLGSDSTNKRLLLHLWSYGKLTSSTASTSPSQNGFVQFSTLHCAQREICLDQWHSHTHWPVTIHFHSTIHTQWLVHIDFFISKQADNRW